MPPAPENTPEDTEQEVVVPWEQVRFGPPDPWVEEEVYDRAVPTKEGAHLTYLLWSRQMDAEAEKSFSATAVRLETAVAVQNESQWRLTMDPRFQQLTLHWLRVVRNGEKKDHLFRDRMRLIQRENQLEHHVVSGFWTLLAVLDDVRPGDIIESAYTYTTRHPISHGWCEAFYGVPAPFVVGCHRLSVLFDSGRPGMEWKGSADAPGRTEQTRPGGRTRWLWEGSQPVPQPAEINQPTTYLGYVWIQVSDVGGWRQLAKRVAEGWATAGDRNRPEEFPGFSRPEVPDKAAVTGLIRHIQDNFRYLSIDLNAGGWLPAAPGVVARRRYGDCKDLAWLAAAVLRGWGLKATPILVGTGLRERVSSLLPMTLLFNHAVVEVEVGGATRWFDLTLRSQGGDFQTQPVGLFNVGLPVDVLAESLQAQPGPLWPNLLAVHETVYLDTRKGEPSVVEQRVWTEGFQAERLRRTWLEQGPEKYSEERLKAARVRLGKVTRIGAIQSRDDREKNTFEQAEVFEVRDAVQSGEADGRAVYDVPSNIIAQNFAIPDDKERRSPWNMPYPMEFRHKITIRCGGLSTGRHVQGKWGEPEVTATLDQWRTMGDWERSSRFIVNVAEIAPDRIGEYRRQFMDLLKAVSWRVFLPRGRARSVPETGLGALPPAGRGLAAYVALGDPAGYPKATIGDQSPYQVKASRMSRFFRPGTRSPRFWVVWIFIIIGITMVQTCSQYR